MDIFGINPTQLSTQKLYRIQYDSCMTTFNHYSGFVVRDTKTFYNEDCDIYRDFSSVVEDHL
jgi:hypothetical protein